MLNEVLTAFEEEERAVAGGHAGTQSTLLKLLLHSLRLAGLFAEGELSLTAGASGV